MPAASFRPPLSPARRAGHAEALVVMEAVELLVTTASSGRQQHAQPPKVEGGALPPRISAMQNATYAFVALHLNS